MLRRLVLLVLTSLLIFSSVTSALAAGRRTRVRHISRVSVQAEGRGSVIAVTYASGPRQHVRFLHSNSVIDRVVLSRAGKNGQQDILAALHDGDVQIWRNEGLGRFSLAMLPREIRPVPERGPRLTLLTQADDAWQWGDERYDAAMPRAPAAAAARAVAAVSLPLRVSIARISTRSSSGRAPPTPA
jgi:hypothetical protein